MSFRHPFPLPAWSRPLRASLFFCSMIVFGLTVTSIRGEKKCVLSIGLSSVLSLSRRCHLSLTLGLDDRVPVKVVLDVVLHASHLEVSQRESVLLLAQLAEVAWTQKQRRHTEYLHSFS